jgi:acetylornithine deacetylase/succinyl-diaminopimelate desuccinylase-like protein
MRRAAPDREAAEAGPDPAALFAFARRVRRDYEAALRQLVEVPTVSADPAHREDLARGAALAADLIHRHGGEARVHRTGGGPLVVGDFRVPGARRTLTLYNHLDVQPASREGEGWRTEPFRLVHDGDRYFGRGTTDDKGPALAALFGIVAARQAGVRVNARLLWETEEEIGSPHLEPTLVRLRRRLATDSVVVSDTSWLSRHRPASTSALRGIVGLRFVLETGDGDAHSGDVGGAARNPIAELMRLMGQIHDARSGRVKVPGFYDDVVSPTRSELADFRRSGFSVASFRRDNRLRRLRTVEPLEVMQRIWARPTFEIHGVAGGYAGPGIKAIVPGRAEVKASCRLVARQRPERVAALIRAFVKRRNPDVTVHTESGGLPYRGLTTGPLADAVRRAVASAFGREPAFVREGGTIGAVVTMRQVLRCPVAFLNLSLPEHGYHAPNENFDWRQASGGIVAFARYLAEVSRL